MKPTITLSVDEYDRLRNIERDFDKKLEEYRLNITPATAKEQAIAAGILLSFVSIWILIFKFWV